MPFEGKLNISRRYPVYLYDGDMSGVGGVAVGSIFVVYAHEDDSSFNTYSANAGNWREFGGGKYTLEVSGSVFNSSGIYFITVSGAGFKDYNFDVEVRGQYLADYFDKIYNVAPASTIATQSDTQTTNDKIDDIAASGTSWVTANLTTTNSKIDQIAASGTNWTTATAADVSGATVTTSGFTPYALSQIVASGDAAGWASVADLTATNSKIDQIAASGVNWITASGWPEVADITSGILSSIVDGTGGNEVPVSSFYRYTLSWVRGNINHTPSGASYYNEYLDADGSSLYTELVTPTGRFLQ